MDEAQGPAGAKLNDDDPQAAEVEATPASADQGGPSAARTPEQVRADIEQTREQLGDTVEALAAKTDIKGQAKQAVADARTSVTETVAGARQTAADKTHGVVSAAQQATPDSAADAGQRVSRLARDNRTALVPAVALMLGVLIGRRRSR